MTTIERILQVIDYYGLKKTSVEKEIGLSNGYFGKMEQKGGSVGSEIIEKILYRFPSLNIFWLITGEGNMIEEKKMAIVSEEQAPYNTKVFPGPCQQCQLRERLLESKDETIRSLQSFIAELTKK